MQITHRISFVFIKTITAPILRKCCTGPNTATRLGICAILMKRETKWNILHWQLLPPLNSLKFTFTAAPSRGMEIGFYFWGKAGLKLFPQTGDDCLVYKRNSVRFLPSWNPTQRSLETQQVSVSACNTRVQQGTVEKSNRYNP